MKYSGKSGGFRTLTEGVTLSGKNTVYGQHSGEAHLLSAEGVNALRQKDRDYRYKYAQLCLFSFCVLSLG